MSNMEQIKECPYCESKDCEVDDWSYGLDYYGECNDCGARGSLAKSKTDAILLWNAAANQIEQLRKERYEAIDENLRWHRIAMESLNERDEARAVARRLYATNKELIEMCINKPTPPTITYLCSIKDDGTTEYKWVYDKHTDIGYVIKDDKAG